MSGRDGGTPPPAPLPVPPAAPPPGAPRHARVYYSRELIAGACSAFAEDNRVYDHRGRIKAPIRALMDHVEGLIDGSIVAGAPRPEDAALIARLTAENDRLRAAAVCAVNGKDHGYSAVWERLISRGLLSFVGGDGSGLSRALAFIDHLAARAAAAPAAAPIAAGTPASVVPTAAEAEAGWLRDKIAYYAEYPDTRCTFSGEGCVTIKQLAKAVGLKKEGT